MPEQPESIDLSVDASEALQRCANYDPHLVNRVMAEMQRDMLAEMLQEARGHKEPIPEVSKSPIKEENPS